MKNILFCFLIFQTNCFSQIPFYQEIINGEVCFIGSSSGDAYSQVTLPTNFPNGTIPKKVFFICYGVKGNNYTPIYKNFEINGLEFQLDTLLKTTIPVGNNTDIPVGTDYNGHVIYIVDMTEYITTINSTINIKWFIDNINPPFGCPGCRISCPGLLIIKEDFSLPPISISLFINDKKNDDVINLNFNQLNHANFSTPIGLGIQTDRVGGNNLDGYRFKINNQNAGAISTADPFLYNILGGAFGCFHYGNNTLTGLTGDTPDSIFSGEDANINVADGLANINSYLNGNIQPINFDVAYKGSSQGQHNVFVSNVIAYSTNCDKINCIISPNRTICKNDTAQLHVSGGTSYEWLPQKDLSCYDCSEPVFTGDSTQTYTVRVWANDSCSVVRPLIVRVEDKSFGYYVNPFILGECGTATSAVNLSATNAVGFSMDNSSFQTSGAFTNLLNGIHFSTFRIDKNGCVFDTTVQINVPSQVTANAYFSASPESGTAPLQVNLFNQSALNDGSWYNINGSIFSGNITSFIADTVGVYTITLFAYQNDSTCVDSLTRIITVTNSGIIIIPQAFSPNEDGKNDVFEIVGLENFPKNELTVFNRWGSEVFHQKNYQNTWNGTAETNRFKGKEKLPTGTYYYVLEIGEESWKGFVYLERE